MIGSIERVSNLKDCVGCAYHVSAEGNSIDA